MGTIVVHEFVSLDGVFEDPSWTVEYAFDPQMGTTLAEIVGSSEAILLGRKTFEMFAPAWSGRTAADDPGAPFFNETPKYVVGARQPAVDWANSTRLGGYDPAAIRALKQRTDGAVYISGSGTLVRALLAAGLVDSLHLFVYPVVLGAGRRLFDERGPQLRLALQESQTYAGGVVHLAYGPAVA
ncbi:dihydrofolate reductase family protein [Skermania piniformis]|uniref:Dihydrofolate reductase family protein n=1 Tax=Skermania pinensis TaxID=39122 RepID=A0ABX8S3P4_9ACTN|nr:dihydrofolate reductase family protein [Skermania piniformis]QXQ12442.1 dihydrofolate reductase family protein [Skermania piniformis]